MSERAIVRPRLRQPELDAGLRASHDGLRYSLKHRRTLLDAICTGVAFSLAGLALVPLLSLLAMLIVRGGPLLNLELLTGLPPAAGMPGGGIGNAIVGTLIVVGIAALFSVPFGLLAAIYLAELGNGSRFESVVRFAAKTLTGLPSILAGVFAYAVVVVTMGRFSALAGGIATGTLMVPIVTLTAEEALRMVPSRMRAAAYGMGSTRAQVALFVVLPAARPAILTGVTLALARAMGETAPLLFTALFSNYWFQGHIDQPIASLAVLIYNYASSPFDDLVGLAWAASLVLVSLVLVTNLVAQWLTRRPIEH
ncbi:MAG TPA: phosphate ABC transporter permease PstA [Polyangiaceae bacterium]|jgi:phosphate transport system permease protein|nr:phosphate ABC transporter permease PstA [Polyangiaceae bacterium]